MVQKTEEKQKQFLLPKKKEKEEEEGEEEEKEAEEEEARWVTVPVIPALGRSEVQGHPLQPFLKEKREGEITVGKI